MSRTITDFAKFLIEEAERLEKEGLTPTRLREWILYKFWDFAKDNECPKPWPFVLKPMLFDIYNSSEEKVIE